MKGIKKILITVFLISLFNVSVFAKYFTFNGIKVIDFNDKRPKLKWGETVIFYTTNKNILYSGVKEDVKKVAYYPSLVKSVTFSIEKEEVHSTRKFEIEDYYIDIAAEVKKAIEKNELDKYIEARKDFLGHIYPQFGYMVKNGADIKELEGFLLYRVNRSAIEGFQLCEYEACESIGEEIDLNSLSDEYRAYVTDVVKTFSLDGEAAHLWNLATQELIDKYVNNENTAEEDDTENDTSGAVSEDTSGVDNKENENASNETTTEETEVENVSNLNKPEAKTPAVVVPVTSSNKIKSVVAPKGIAITYINPHRRYSVSRKFPIFIAP